MDFAQISEQITLLGIDIEKTSKTLTLDLIHIKVVLIIIEYEKD